MAKVFIDLHMHSTHSDGSDTTKQLLENIHKAGLSVVSFTDHDNVGVYGELSQYPQDMQALTIVPGVELSFAYNGYSRDMLGYGMDIQAIQKVLDAWYTPQKRLETQRQTLIAMKDVCRKHGMLFDEGIEVSTGKKTEAYILLHASLMRYPQNLERFPFLKVNTKFYWHYMNKKGSPFFVDETFGRPSLKDVIQAIYDTGGMAFLAHPCGYNLDQESVVGFVHDAARQGIRGIEVQHEAYTQQDVAFLKGLADELDLYQSGGSDYHGELKPGLALGVAFGNVLVQMEEIQSWINKIKMYRI